MISDRKFPYIIRWITVAATAPTSTSARRRSRVCTARASTPRAPLSATVRLTTSWSRRATRASTSGRRNASWRWKRRPAVGVAAKKPSASRWRGPLAAAPWAKLGDRAARTVRRWTQRSTETSVLGARATDQTLLQLVIFKLLNFKILYFYLIFTFFF